jgi:hypothetical protein
MRLSYLILIGLTRYRQREASLQSLSPANAYFIVDPVTVEKPIRSSRRQPGLENNFHPLKGSEISGGTR